MMYKNLVSAKAIVVIEIFIDLLFEDLPNKLLLLTNFEFFYEGSTTDLSLEVGRL